MDYFNNTKWDVPSLPSPPNYSLILQLVELTLLGLIGLQIGKAYSLQYYLWKSRVSPSIPKVSEFPFLGAPFTYIRNYKKMMQIFEKWFKEFGPTFRFRILGNDAVITGDADIAQKLLGSNRPEYLQRPPFIYHKYLGDTPMADGIGLSNDEMWRQNRQLLSKVFGYRDLKLYIPLINSYGERMVKDLKSKSCTLPHLIHTIMLQAVFRLSMGTNILKGKEKTDSLLEKIDRMAHIVTMRSNPFLALDLIWWFHPRRRELLKLCKSITDFIIQDGILPARESIKKGVKESKDGLNNPLEMMIEGGMSDNQILSELLTLIVAGHETTSISLIMLFYHLAKSQQDQIKCREEVDLLFERMRVEGRNEILMEDTSELKYLERCTKESLRLIPGLPVLARKLQSSLKMDKIELGKGTFVLVSPWLVHRNPEYYPEPEKFDPDRFLRENCQNRHPYAYIPFSAGPRNCLAWRLAMLEMKILAAWILHNFEIYTNDTIEDKLRFRITFELEKEIEFTLKERSVI